MLILAVRMFKLICLKTIDCDLCSQVLALLSVQI